MVELTVFELHLDEPSFTANAPFSGSKSDDETATETDESDENGRSAPVLPAVVGLVALLVVAVAVRRYLGGGSDAAAVE